MAEYVNNKEETINVGEPIIFENKTEASFDVSLGVVFRKSGLYRVSMYGKNVSIQKEPERMRGRWQEITEGDCSGYDPVLAGYDDPVVGYVCSVCHEGYEKEVMGKTTWDFCPNCGADMRGEQDALN